MRTMTYQPRHVGHDVSEARSALRLRAVLAGFGLLVGLVGTAVFSLLLRDDSGNVGYVVGALVCLAIALSAVVDLGVIARRTRQRRGGSHR